MARTHLSTTGALIVCLIGTQWSGTLFASMDPPSSVAPVSPLVVDSTSEAQGRTEAGPAAAVPGGEQPRRALELPLSTVEGSRFRLTKEMFAANAPLAAAPSFAQRGGYGGRGRGGRNATAQAAIVLGAVASIAGAAVLVYANRPECSTTQFANGCGYGTKVVGGAVLSAGMVGLLVGALTWR
jgi:hypothetical protein